MVDIINTTAVRIPARAEVVFWLNFDTFWVIQAAFVIAGGGGQVRCKSPLEPSKPYLKSFDEIRVADYQCNRCRAPFRSRNWFLLAINFSIVGQIQAAFAFVI